MRLQVPCMGEEGKQVLFGSYGEVNMRPVTQAHVEWACL